MFTRLPHVLCALLLCAACAAACTPAPSPAPADSVTPAASATPTSTPAPTDTPAPSATSTRTATPTGTPSATPSATTIPTAVVAATPTRPPAGASATPSATATAAREFQIALSGSDTFVARTQQTLRFLNSCAPAHLAAVQRYIGTIQQSSRSGMEVGTGVFMASDVTAFAPGYSAAAQVFWYAGAIVHDARHRWQAQQGTPTNWNTNLEQRQAIEQDARGVQIAALQLCRGQVPPAAGGEADYLLKYLTDMQSGQRPCDYCEVEWQNRNW